MTSSFSRRFLAALLGALLCLLCARAEAETFLGALDTGEKQILDHLHQGRVVEAHRFGENGNMGSLWKVRIEHNGKSRWAVFKPRQYGDRDGWARSPMEAAVYKLDRILGMGIVPPVAYRKNLNLGGNHFHEGALVQWVDGVHGVKGVPEHDWHPRREVFSSDLRILQAISRDADNQNIHNIVRAKHWSSGQWRLMKVDNEASMRQGAYVNLEHHLPTWGEVKRFRQRTYQRLKELNYKDLKGDVGEFLSDREIRDWLKTRDLLVRHIENRAKQQKDVFFTEKEVSFDARYRVGKTASRSFRAKFGAKMKAKNVRVEYLKRTDARLQGAQGKTVLRPDGIRVLLAEKPTRATLVEELVHVNQLLSMAKRVGGLAVLHDTFTGESRYAGLLTASMEKYAKGRTATTLRGKAKAKVRAEKDRFGKQLHKAGVRESGQPLWRKVGGRHASPKNSVRTRSRVR